ncbi:MAG TPA: hypothetical protein VHM70_24190 [Polyangiaceae bacterium]|jgi:hypothetical protein|nr:hypothetical protein [Polyangiaceae bacterium]
MSSVNRDHGTCKSTSTAPTISRRVTLLLAPASLVGLVFGCKSEPKVDCTDVSAVSAPDLARRSALGYQVQAPKPEMACTLCVHYVAGATPDCGTCRVLPGPVSPAGYCKLFAAKG